MFIPFKTWGRSCQYFSFLLYSSGLKTPRQQFDSLFLLADFHSSSLLEGTLTTLPINLQSGKHLVLSTEIVQVSMENLRFICIRVNIKVYKNLIIFSFGWVEGRSELSVGDNLFIKLCSRLNS